MRPTFVAPELDPELGIAHCLTPESLDRALTRDARTRSAAMVVSPTYFGACADVAALAEVAHSHGVPLVVDEAWGAHLAFHPDLPGARARGRRRPRGLEHPQDRRQPDPVGDAPPRPGAAGRIDADDRRPLRDPGRVDQPELAAARLARRRSPLRGHPRARAARRRPCQRWTRSATRCARSTASTCSTSSLAGRSGRRRLRPAAPRDRRPRHRRDRLRLASILRELDDIDLELAGENVVVAIFGIGEPAGRRASDWSRRCARRSRRSASGRDRSREDCAAAAVGRAGDDPREAFLGPQEVVPRSRPLRPDRRRVARRLPAGNPERAARRAAHGRDARATSRRRSSTAAACAAPATAGSTPSASWRRPAELDWGVIDETAPLADVLVGPPDHFRWLPTSAISKAALASGRDLTPQDVATAHAELVGGLLGRRRSGPPLGARSGAPLPGVRPRLEHLVRCRADRHAAPPVVAAGGIRGRDPLLRDGGHPHPRDGDRRRARGRATWSSSRPRSRCSATATSAPRNRPPSRSRAGCASAGGRSGSSRSIPTGSISTCSSAWRLRAWPCSARRPRRTGCAGGWPGTPSSYSRSAPTTLSRCARTSSHSAATVSSPPPARRRISACRPSGSTSTTPIVAVHDGWRRTALPLQPLRRG